MAKHDLHCEFCGEFTPEGDYFSLESCNDTGIGVVVCPACVEKMERPDPVKDILDKVAEAKGGLVALGADKQTFFIVKKLAKAGKLEYCGRDHDGAGNRWITVRGVAKATPAPRVIDYDTDARGQCYSDADSGL